MTIVTGFEVKVCEHSPLGSYTLNTGSLHVSNYLMSMSVLTSMNFISFYIDCKTSSRYWLHNVKYVPWPWCWHVWSRGANIVIRIELNPEWIIAALVLSSIWAEVGRTMHALGKKGKCCSLSHTTRDQILNIQVTSKLHKKICFPSTHRLVVNPPGQLDRENILYFSTSISFW